MRVYKLLLIGVLILTLSLLFSGFIYLQENKDQNLLYKILDEKVTDYDGNEYGTVKIGNQIWMLENLKVTHYSNGNPIPNVHDNEKWLHAKDGAYCLVKNDSVNYKKTYGVLYNFYAVINENILSPKGWHIPTQQECITLINYLGGNAIAGKKIKDNALNLWVSNNNFSTNESGFSGLPAGGRGRLGSAGDVGYYATWWSSTSYDSLYAWHWGVHPDKKSIRSNPGHKSSGFSIRCIKD